MSHLSGRIAEGESREARFTRHTSSVISRHWSPVTGHRSLLFYARLPYELPPPRMVGLDERLELRGIARLGVEAEAFELRLHFAHPDDRDGLAVHALDDGLRRFRGKSKAQPAARLEAGIAALGQGRHVGQR